MNKRIERARALALNRAILLSNEPTPSLNPMMSEAVHQLIL